jgi:hypothetical protein
MPRGPAPAWTQRKEPVVDEYVMASVTAAGGLGRYHPETGHYAELIVRGLNTREEAAEWKRALFRCAHFLNRHGTPVSMSAQIERAGDGYQIRFAAVDKTKAREHVMARYGTNRTKWPYDPRRRGNG